MTVLHRDSLAAAVHDTIVRVASPADVRTPPWWERGFIQTLVGGALALIGGWIVERMRHVAQMRRRRERLLRRTCHALHVCEATATIVGELKGRDVEIPEPVLNAVVSEWQGYDRVSDDACLLKDVRLAFRADEGLRTSRVRAELLLQDEGRRKERQERVGETELSQSATTEEKEASERLRKLFADMAKGANEVNTEIALKWPRVLLGEEQ
jgi:hypothetical protein